jgi:hypothetical protein
MKSAGLVWFIPLLLLLTVACESEVGEEPGRSYDELVAEGTAALGVADAIGAHDAFAGALELRRHDATASLGLVLADVQSLFVLADDLLAMIGGLSGSQTMALNNPGGLGPGSTLDDTLHHFIKQIAEKLLDEMVAALDDANADPQVSLKLPAMPLNFQGATLLDLQGSWDSADVLMLTAIVRLMQGAIDLIQGINLDMDLGPWIASDLVHDIATGQSVDYSAALEEIITLLIQTLEDEDFPDFLLMEDDGEWRFARCQRNLALATIHFVDIWPLVDGKSPQQSDELLGYSDANENGERDGNEPYTFQGEPFPTFLTEALPALRAIGFELFVALAENTDLDIDPDSYATFDLWSLNMALGAFGLPPVLAHQEVDLAAFFADPPLEEFKESLDEGLHCFADQPDPRAAFDCLVALLGI